MGVAVVADSEEICDRALRLIKIEWEERPFILDMEEAAKPDAPKIMTEVRRMSFMGFRGSKDTNPNVIVTEEREIGNVEKGFAEADKVIEYTIKRAMNSPAGVEAMACVAQWRNDFLDLWVHHQANPQSNLSAQGMTMGMSFRRRHAAASSLYALVQDNGHVSLTRVRGLEGWPGLPTPLRLYGLPSYWPKEPAASR